MESGWQYHSTTKSSTTVYSRGCVWACGRPHRVHTSPKGCSLIPGVCRESEWRRASFVRRRGTGCSWRRRGTITKRPSRRPRHPLTAASSAAPQPTPTSEAVLSQGTTIKLTTCRIQPSRPAVLYAEMRHSELPGVAKV